MNTAPDSDEGSTLTHPERSLFSSTAVASQILLSLKFENDTWNLIVPEGVTDIQALVALQEKHRELQQSRDPAVVLEELKTFVESGVATDMRMSKIVGSPHKTGAEAGQKYLLKFRDLLLRPLFSSEDLQLLSNRTSVATRNCDQPRFVSIAPVVSETVGAPYDTQKQVLMGQQMRLAEPIEQALVAAAFYCRSFDEKLFGRYLFEKDTPGVNLPLSVSHKGLPLRFAVRSAVPDMAIEPGVDAVFQISNCPVTCLGKYFAASGVPLESKTSPGQEMVEVEDVSPPKPNSFLNSIGNGVKTVVGWLQG